MRRIAVIYILLSGVIAAGQARAQSVSDQAAADALFEDGIRLRNAGDHEAACDRFERSQILEPALGTLQNIGMCLEEQDKLISALNTFQKLLDKAEKARDIERIAVAQAKLKLLREVVPRLLVRMPDDADIAGLAIFVNNEPLRAALLGFSTPVDPGQYHVTARAPGHERWSKTVVLEAGKRAVVEIPKLDSLEQATKTKGNKKNKTRVAEAKIPDPKLRASINGDKDQAVGTNRDKEIKGITAGASVGVSSFLIGDLDLGRQPTFSAEGAWVVGDSLNGVEIGGVLAATSFEWRNGSSQRRVSRLYSMIANVTATRPFAPKWRVRGQLGLGALIISGLDEEGHPLLEPGTRSVGTTVTLPQFRFAVGVDYLVTPRLYVVMAPLIYWYSPRLDQFLENVENLSGIRSTLGIGYLF